MQTTHASRLLTPPRLALALLLGLLPSTSAWAAAGRSIEDRTALQIYAEAIKPAEINATRPKASLKNIVKALTQLRTPFDHTSTKMIDGKLKLVHGGDKTQAAMGVLRFVPAQDNGLGGFLGEGGLVVARASSTFPGGKSFGPGLSMMRPGKPGEQPLNGFFLQSLLGQGKNRNYFANTLSNDVRPKNIFARAAFELVQAPIRAITWHPTKSPLGQSIAFMRADHLAMSFDAQGNGQGKTIKRIELRPTAAAQATGSASSKNTVAADLSQVKLGTVTHQVFADGKLVGHFAVERPFVGTQYRLHVRHPRGRPGSAFNRRK